MRDCHCYGVGTSPRVRGKRVSATRCSPGSGYIPACAGETFSRLAVQEPQTVHPRVCGGNHSPQLTNPQLTGTSPRVRGKRHAVGFGDGGSGYIPACAGETAKGIGPKTAVGVHPRVCGGNCASFRATRGVPGTSPRVRGKPIRNGIRAPASGYIPACAGETSRCPRSPSSGTSPRVRGKPQSQVPVRLCPRVHPRVCGGNPQDQILVVHAPGTSPRVRGKLDASAESDDPVRYIPACAGETLRPPDVCHPAKVHPRVCGGNRSTDPPAALICGTSPRVKPESGPVHPRVCGGNQNRVRPTPSRTGTSPRVRGKPPCSTPFCPVVGYIPACAGETGSVPGAPVKVRVHPRVCGGCEAGCRPSGIMVHPRVCGGNASSW